MAVIKSLAVNELTRVCEREEKGREEMGCEENRTGLQQNLREHQYVRDWVKDVPASRHALWTSYEFGSVELSKGTYLHLRLN